MNIRFPPAHVAVLLAVVAVVVVVVAVKAYRESLTDCAAGDGGVPCKVFGCDWIDKNSFGTAKVCDCRNCRKCVWDDATKRCLSRDEFVAADGSTDYVGADAPQDLSGVVVGYERPLSGQVSKDMKGLTEKRAEDEKSFWNLWGFFS